MDRRYNATQKYIDDEYLEDSDDTFWKNNDRSGGTQGNERRSKQWSRIYRENETRLWETNLLGPIFVPPDGDGSTVLFCNAIDEVTAHLIGDLSQGVQLDTMEVEKVYELCGCIVRGRTAVDWAIENNLFIDRMDKWKNHVLVIMSYAALMVVADMIHRKLVGQPCARRRAQNICSSKKAALGLLGVFGTAICVCIFMCRRFRA